MIDYSRIKKQIKDLLPEITELRQAIHRHPEIACKEFETAKRVKEELSSLHLDILPPFLETDVVALLNGTGEGKNVTLRADMDALPLQEKTNLPYTSTIDGMMHSCGHDDHTAILVGAAKVLDSHRDTFDGSVRFVFQPGEEVAAAGKDLVEAGALLNPPPAAVFALHGDRAYDAGAIASKKGIASAATDFFKIKIIGKGAHGCRPQDSIDPIITGSRIVGSLQSIHRNFTAFEPIVISVCKFCSGNNGNVIPDTAELEGTVRSFSMDVSNSIKEKIERVVKSTCESMGAQCEIEYRQAYIPIDNNGDAVELGKKITLDVLNSDWVDMDKPGTGGEDFSYYLVDYPGAMFRLGLGADSAPVHNPLFDFNDEVLYHGILLLVSAALETLKK